MCTVTFIPRNGEYLLAMNRDDEYKRMSALPIHRVQFTTHAAAYPQETGGGTWVGVNQQGIAFALLNWAVRPNGSKEKSRGAVIPQMLVASDLARARILFDSIDLDGTWPFRLIGFFPAERAVNESRWDGERTTELSHEWGARNWFSSGASDEKAEATRSAVCSHYWHTEEAGTREWLRRLHATHEPELGPFSICAHRNLGGTLSYTEIEVTTERAALAHSPSSPCRGVSFTDTAVMVRLLRPATFV